MSKFSAAQLDSWFFRAQAFNYNSDEKDIHKRLKVYTLTEYFDLVFPKEAKENWVKNIRQPLIQKYSKYFFKNDLEKRLLINSFLEYDLAEFMQCWFNSSPFELPRTLKDLKNLTNNAEQQAKTEATQPKDTCPC